jgi:hypothetical protein
MSDSKKALYHPPELRSYGTLRELTLTANRGSCDNPSNPQSCGNHSTARVK